MIKFNIKKVYFKTYTPFDPYRYEDRECAYIGVMEHECEDQSADTLGEGEQFVITIEKIPFIRFRILLSPENKFHLMSISPISLRTFEEQQYRVERWGDHETVRDAINKMISVVAGFINLMGKEEVNDGNYYKS